MSENYDILSENNQSTVVSHYERTGMVRETFYQSETDLEREMIEQLQRQGDLLGLFFVLENHSP